MSGHQDLAQPVPILMYHDLRRTPLPDYTKYTVTPGAFARHLAWLSFRGYSTVSLDHLFEAWRGRRELPRLPVVITFDDGFQSCIEEAVPLLRARGFTATFFLVTTLMGRTSEWLLRERGFEVPLIGWDIARNLCQMGFECGSHSVTHPRLDGLSAANCERELNESRRELEDHLGIAVRHLSYPFGSFNEDVMAAADRAGYVSACTTRPGLSTPRESPLALRRIHVTGEDTIVDFVCRLHNGRNARDWMRH